MRCNGRGAGHGQWKRIKWMITKQLDDYGGDGRYRQFAQDEDRMTTHRSMRHPCRANHRKVRQSASTHFCRHFCRYLCPSNWMFSYQSSRTYHFTFLLFRSIEGDKKQDGQQQQVASLKQQQQKQGMPDSPSSLQNFPLGSKRKEIKSVKGVLNSGMNAPLNGGSRSRPSSTPGSPLVEPRLQLSTQQQQQQQQQLNSQAMNGLTSAAARSAKVKSDLLMGLNSSSIRSDRHSAAVNMKDGSDGSQYDTNGYGQQHSPMMGSAVTGPPPGLSMPNGNSNNNTNHNNSGSPYSMSNLLGRQPESSQSLYGNTNGKPLDVATMMSALDLFGPGQASSLMMSPNWSLASGHSQQQQQQQQQKQQQQHQQQDKNSGSNTSQSSPSLASAASGGATARSVEDLELQVINAKMETQMLENQLNAVIKRNRRKLYA